LTENHKTKFEEDMERLGKIGILRALMFNILYIWALFGLCSIVVLLVNAFYPLSSMPDNSWLVIAGVFAAISVIDFGLIYQDKISPTIIALVLVLAVPYVLYRLFTGIELISLNKKSIPVKVKRYIFHIPGC
jgi:hypothetical protein